MEEKKKVTVYSPGFISNARKFNKSMDKKSMTIYSSGYALNVRNFNKWKDKIWRGKTFRFFDGTVGKYEGSGLIVTRLGDGTMQARNLYSEEVFLDIKSIYNGKVLVAERRVKKDKRGLRTTGRGLRKL
jgi:hypothetical protein